MRNTTITMAGRRSSALAVFGLAFALMIPVSHSVTADVTPDVLKWYKSSAPTIQRSYSSGAKASSSTAILGNWSQPALLNTNGTSDSGSDGAVRIASDASGTLHAVWESDDAFGADHDIFYSQNAGGGWSAPALVNTNGNSDSGYDRWPELTVDNSGTVYVVWFSDENLNGTAGTDTDIFYSRNSGSSWTSPALVNTNGNSDSDDDVVSKIVVDDSGTLHVVWWAEDNTNDDDIFYSQNSGSGWTDPSPIGTPGTGQDVFPQMVIDNSGTLHVVWMHELYSQEVDELDIYYSKNSGSGWSTPISIVAPGSELNDAVARLTVDSSGTIHAIWCSGREIDGPEYTDYDIFCASNSGSGWSTPVLVNVDGGSDTRDDIYPEMIVDGFGTMHAVWMAIDDIDNGPYYDYQLFYTMNKGAGWTTPRVMDSVYSWDVEWIPSPALALDSSRTLHAAWPSRKDLNGTAGTDYDILHATLAPITLDPIGMGMTAVECGERLSFEVTASTFEDITPTLTASNLPDDATFTDNRDGTGTFMWDTDESDLGTYPAVLFEANYGAFSDSEEGTIWVVTLVPAMNLLGLAFVLITLVLGVCWCKRRDCK
ncbi:sialidase family protein [Candidatus Hydrogenedentota bacterium]